MAIREFPTLVKKVKIVEHLECSNWVVKTRGDGSSGSKKGNHQKKPYSRPQQHHGGSTVPQVGKQGEVLRLWWTTLCLSMYSKGGQSAKSSNTLPSTRVLKQFVFVTFPRATRVLKHLQVLKAQSFLREIEGNMEDVEEANRAAVESCH
ncbi:hypothetical protein JHK87_010066 [Glycine soja]|nr:hypothetical protein JHK87_010066 [Glycine soja]